MSAIPAQAPTRLTPMFAQYLSIKEEYPDALLFYRMGDFYELFFKDAEIAARELQIALTSRNPGADEPVPMCGVPHHSVQSYLSQLLEKGFTVAVCEQVEDPKTAKGLVKRAVTRVLTPSTAVEDSNLSAKDHTYLGALLWNEDAGAGAFAWMDFTTGQWSGLQSRREADLWQWVQKLSPRELLLPDPFPEGWKPPSVLALNGVLNVPVPARAYFDLKGGAEKLRATLKVAELGALGLEDKPELTRACGALISYLLQTQKQELEHLSEFVPLDLGRHLIIDEVSERNLEIFRRLDGRKGKGTLRHVLDQTLTPMGGRLLEDRLRHPWRERGLILENQEAVRYLVEQDKIRDALTRALDDVYDMERLSTRISLNRTTPKDFAALRQSLAALPAVLNALLQPPREKGYPTEDERDGKSLPAPLARLVKEWDNLGEYRDLLERSLAENPPHVITEGGLFRPGYNSQLDELLDLAEHGEARLQELLQREQDALGMAKLKLGYNRVFGYYFELSRSVSASLPERFTRRQTLANAERFVTPELKELEDRLVSASDQRKQLEFKLFQQLREAIAAARPRLLFMAGLIATLDYWQSLASVARRWGWCCPEIGEDAEIRIRQGRHPVVEAMIGSADFVPNDLSMDTERRLLLITGPNMAGKSTVLRQTALVCILAQMGSYVPAASAYIGMVDRVFSRVGASDNLAQGQSTFMVEMMETARILRQVTSRSLVILDEIGRGTSTFDGMALAWAVVEDLARRGRGAVRTLFATHYHELTSLEGRLEGLRNMNIAVREHAGDILFMRKLVPGPADRSYGIEVARLAGVPQSVVGRAREILETLEQTRSAGARRDTAKAFGQLLPGFAPEPPAKKPGAARLIEVPHPLVETLRDLDTDHVTPMKALALITEWKTLWGNNDA